MTALDRKTALVTGAAQGLGAAIAAKLAQNGARVFATDVKDPTASFDGDVSFLKHDVVNEDDWAAVMGRIREQGALHILVNNAGVEGDPNAPKDPEHAPLADWRRIFQVNVDGVFLGCRAAIPAIKEAGGGAIVNVSSVASLVPTPFISAYGASKAAVAHHTLSVALHCAQMDYAVRCNSVHPGQVRTPMLEGLFARWAKEQGGDADGVADAFREGIPLKKFQEPIDIANLVAFLASDDARFITGQFVACDGGFTLTN